MVRAWAAGMAVRISAEARSRDSALRGSSACGSRSGWITTSGVPSPLSLGSSDRPGDPPQAVAPAASAARAVRGARVGGLRAADRIGPARRRSSAGSCAGTGAAAVLRHAARPALGCVAGGALACGDRRVRACAEAVDRAGARGARGGLRTRRPEPARAGLAATARDPQHRQLDARDAGGGGPGPRRPAPGPGRGLPQVRGPGGRAWGAARPRTRCASSSPPMGSTRRWPGATRFGADSGLRTLEV